jgi:RNA polymerase sigma-70 factor (ECF subfamily)
MEKLINGCKEGKRGARKELFDKYRSLLLGICLRYSKNKSEAEDILMEGFINIYTKINTYSHQGAFEGWMRKVMVNTAIDYHRKNEKYNKPDDIDEHYNIQSKDEDALKQLSAKEIMALIQKMPPGYRLVFNLYAIEGYTHKEISQKFEISVSTSKSQLQKARLWIIKRLNITDNQNY